MSGWILYAREWLLLNKCMFVSYSLIAIRYSDDEDVASCCCCCCCRNNNERLVNGCRRLGSHLILLLGNELLAEVDRASEEKNVWLWKKWTTTNKFEKLETRILPYCFFQHCRDWCVCTCLARGWDSEPSRAIAARQSSATLARTSDGLSGRVWPTPWAKWHDLIQ